MKIFVLAILFYIIGISNLDIRIDGARLNGIPFEAAENCGGLPCLVYLQPERDISRYILNNVQDVYWNEKYIYAIDSKTHPSSVSFIVTYIQNDCEDEPFVVSDTLNESQANQILESMHIDLSKMHHVNIDSDEFAITFYLKAIGLFVGCSLLAYLIFFIIEKIVQYHRLKLFNKSKFSETKKDGIHI